MVKNNVRKAARAIARDVIILVAGILFAAVVQGAFSHGPAPHTAAWRQ